MKKESQPSFHTHGISTPSKHTICFVAGHSGGHIIPCLTLAKQEHHKDQCRVLFFTSSKSLDQSIIAQSGMPLHHVSLPIGQQRRWYQLPLLAFSLVWATITGFISLITYMPERIITTGSIVAVPVCISGWLLGIPIELFELNAQPGNTTRWLAHIAETIRYCFTQTRTQLTHNNCILMPYPIRFSQPITTQQFPQFDSQRFTIFVQGGSQGSHQINMLMQSLLENHPELCKKIQVLHQTGTHTQELKKLYAQKKVPALLFAYDHDLTPYYQKADLVICRSGAGALFETLHFQKPCITMPLITPSNDHQLHNAQAIAAQYPHFFKVALSHDDAINTLYKIFRT